MGLLVRVLLTAVAVFTVSWAVSWFMRSAKADVSAAPEPETRDKYVPEVQLSEDTSAAADPPASASASAADKKKTETETTKA